MSDQAKPQATDDVAVIIDTDIDEPVGNNERSFVGWQATAIAIACATYTAWHLVVLNYWPVETWTYRIMHIAGGLVLGFFLVSAARFDEREKDADPLRAVRLAVLGVSSALVGWSAFCIATAWFIRDVQGDGSPPDWVFASFGWPLGVGSGLAIVGGWVFRGKSRRVQGLDMVLALAAVVVAAYLIFVLTPFRMRAGTGLAQPADFWAAMIGAFLIMELTRRVAGLPLVVISGVFLVYTFAGPYLPGILNHRGYTAQRFFTYIYTDRGVLGPVTAVSSTYIILFITFAAFLQASKVGDYFVNFAFAVAGTARGGPAKVAVFASGLMGMINGTSAGNVVATGSLTIPLMKRVGYSPRTAGAIEAAASSGGQIMPPIMGAGAFIMAEVTGIPYTDIVVAATIPAILYFISIYFMVDLEAAKLGMRGLPRKSLPSVSYLAKQCFLFAPIIILIYTLFSGYSVIRAGTLAMVAAAVVSWFSPVSRMGLREVFKALELAARMAIQLIAVCACAGIIVGVIAMTGIGLRFSSMLLALADSSQFLALFFAMCISILLGMGMPTTAAYAVAASVVAPGLVQLGVPLLIAHFFVFYFAVMSAITPPVALAAFAAAGISGDDAMKTSVVAFKTGLAAFIIPFMAFYSPALLMQGEWVEVLHVLITASLGVFLLAAAVQGWFFGRLNWVPRILLLMAALGMIQGDWITDGVGFGIAGVIFLWQRRMASTEPITQTSEA